jgi:hypothetical protein
MSQAAVEQILGRLMTDEAFRNLFFTGEASLILGRYPLTETERNALLHSRSTLRKDQFELQEMLLDAGICRARLERDPVR